jgi:hypothetical protein
MMYTRALVPIGMGPSEQGQGRVRKVVVLVAEVVVAAVGTIAALGFVDGVGVCVALLLVVVVACVPVAAV